MRKAAPEAGEPSRKARFNGAATYSLRKARSSCASSRRPNRFNGAATYSLRKVLKIENFLFLFFCFNGAATYSLRKVDVVHALALVHAVASMGPQHTRCGKLDAVDELNDAFSLQWGRNILVAESWCWWRRMRAAHTLQWGRNILVAERNTLKYGKMHSMSASMGPQHTRCGKP